MGENEGHIHNPAGRREEGVPPVSRAGAIPSSPQSVEDGRPQPHAPLLRRVFVRLLHLWFWASRGMTLGTRAIVRDEAGRIFLVRHSYIPGWHLPGGGVEWGQTLEEGLAMELREEGNIRMTAPPQWVGVYLNRAISRRDHVALFLVENFEQTGPREPDREIIETGFFPTDALPDGTSAATRRRLAEVFDATPKSPYW